MSTRWEFVNDLDDLLERHGIDEHLTDGLVDVVEQFHDFDDEDDDDDMEGDE